MVTYSSRIITLALVVAFTCSAPSAQGLTIDVINSGSLILLAVLVEPLMSTVVGQLDWRWRYGYQHHRVRP